MTQTATVPAAPHRAGASGDAPDIMFVIRHYRWLLIVGPILGLLVATAAYFACRRYIPEYTAEAQYQVLPLVQDDLLDHNANRTETSKEEIDRTIHRQQLLITSDRVLDSVLETDAFAKDPDPANSGLKSHWLRTHDHLPKQQLLKVLDVSAVPNTDVFRIAMRGEDPVELATLVNAIGNTYFSELRNIEQADRNKATEELANAQKNLDQSVKTLADQLNEFKQSHDISAITQSYNIKMSTFGSLSTELMKAENETQQARAYVDLVKKQVENGSVQLSPDMEQYINTNANLQNLEANKVSLDEELAVDIQLYGENHTVSHVIQLRITEVQKQIDQMREKLRKEASDRMQDDAQNRLTSAQSAEQDLTTRQHELDTTLKDLDTALVEYRNRSALLENQQKLLDQLNTELTMRRLMPRTDVTRVQLFSPASAKDKDDISFPQAKMFLPVGSILGLAIAFGLAYLLELTNTRVRSPRDITRTMQMPLLGFVPDQVDDSLINGDLATSIRTSPSSMIAESFRQIRGRLAATANGTPLTSLLIASASPGGGATTVASNLANGIALNGLRVLLVDANFYRPGLKNAYKNLPATGFSDILAGRASLDDVLFPSPELPTLQLLAGGTLPASTASELLESRAFKDLLAQMRAQFDMVIFDGAPLNLVSDSISLSAKVDGVIAVVRAGTISRGTVTRVRDQLKQVHANLLGIILNAAQVRGSGYFKQNYRNFYEYAAAPTSPRIIPAASTAN